MNNVIKCAGCHHEPHQLSEFIFAAKDENMTPEEYIKTEEATFNVDNNLFYCTACYIKAGMPIGKAK
jgi:hypothetical protein